MGTAKKVLKNTAMAAALGPIGTAALLMLGGSDEQAGQVFLACEKNPGATPQEIAQFVRNETRREAGAQVMSGFCDGLRRGPLVENGFESNGEDPQAVVVDLDDPLSILIASETRDEIENHPLARNLEIALDLLEEAENARADEIGMALHLKRRQSFEIKSRQVDRARAVVKSIRSQILRDLDLAFFEETEQQEEIQLELFDDFAAVEI
jgi:hypothetical protein